MASTRSGIEFESVTYPQDSEAYRFEYDPETTPASMALIAALSETMDVDPIELEPLHASADTDALDALICGRDRIDRDVHVTLTHERREMTVYSKGVVTVTPLEHERTDDQSRANHV